MPIVKSEDIHLEEVKMTGVVKTTKANVIGNEQGWKDHTLRLFCIEPGGNTPKHQHDWEHINYVTKGSGQLLIGDKIHEVKTGDYAFVPSNTDHQFSNPNDSDFEFICIVSNRGAY